MPPHPRSTPPGVPPALLIPAIGNDAARFVSTALQLSCSGSTGQHVDRASVAMALNAILFAGLLERVPTAAAYVEGVVAGATAVCFDHGALRTIDGATGSLPRGVAAFTRILEPLGYTLAGVYPLPRLGMTGRAYAHCDEPHGIPQFFVSELHIDRLDAEGQRAAAAIFDASLDPFGDAERELLSVLERDRTAPLELAAQALPGLAAAFGRHHSEPTLDDYEALLSRSAEGGWIATEGNAFNHATDRVADVTALADRLRGEGWPVKATVEVSASGRVLQTAFLADKVQRRFAIPGGGNVEREVPGSFYEFITRHPDPSSGQMDLSFDSANATGIFAVTSAG